MSFCLGKATPSTGPALFLSREQEAATRSASTRRLCLAIYCAEAQTILQHASAIQERIVETLRQSMQASGTSACVAGPEMFLLWRVLLVKLGNWDNLLGLLPIVLTETRQIFEALLSVQRDKPPRDLTATFIQMCKLIDVLVLLSPPTILLYQYCFHGKS